MNLLRVEDGLYTFHLEKREKQLLTLVLSLYPVIPSAHQSISKSVADLNNANQHLLDEALAEQRNENKRLINGLITDTSRFSETKTGWRMKLKPGDIEWLLQVLNDVRVGNWIVLGSPEEDLPDIKVTDQNAPYVGAMQLSGFFQLSLLAALEKPKNDRKS